MPRPDYAELWQRLSGRVSSCHAPMEPAEGEGTMDDDLEARRPQAGAKNLDAMSLEALRDYGAELKAEMARVEAAIAAKEAARLSADSFFKT